MWATDTHKYQTRPKKRARDKHSSLFFLRTSDKEKSFITLTLIEMINYNILGKTETFCVRINFKGKINLPSLKTHRDIGRVNAALKPHGSE
jgi:hypothetical protein